MIDIHSYANTLLVTFNNRAFAAGGGNLTQQTPSFADNYPRPIPPMTFATNPTSVNILRTTHKVSDADISLNRLEVRILDLNSFFCLFLSATARFFKRQTPLR